MNVYLLLGVLIAWAMYVPIGRAVLASKAEQNLATFILWGILDAEAAGSLMVQGGNWYLAGAFVLGCIAMIACILRSGNFKWGWMETVCAFIVLWCAYEWIQSGPRAAAIISTTGVVVAGLPMFKDAFYSPEKMPVLPYTGFFVANALSTYGGAAWTVEERLYPAACTVLCLAFVMVTQVRTEVFYLREVRLHLEENTMD